MRFRGGGVCVLSGEGRNEQDVHSLAVEVAGLKRDIEHLVKEISLLREHMDKGFERREKTVDKLLIALEARIQEKLAGLKDKFNEYTPIESFKPVNKWLTIIGAAVITGIITLAVSLANALMDFWQNVGLPK